MNVIATNTGANTNPILADRLFWRAQTFRHTVHLLPGQTVLELGCGELRFTRALLQVSRKENPITAVTFQPGPAVAADVFPNVELIQLQELPGALAGRQFNYVVAMDLLDRSTSSELLAVVYNLLAPGGELVFYESNPWNPVYKLKGALLGLMGKRDPRNLLIARVSMKCFPKSVSSECMQYLTISSSPRFARLIWFLRNLSILLENTPILRRTAGSILVHAQKPPAARSRRPVSLCAHESLRRALSVVIPCHNEEMNVGPLIEQILQYYGDYIHEIIPVNDGSTDQTGAKLEELARAEPRIKPLHRTPPNGVGLALADGLKATTGRYILSLDCDFQHLLAEFRDLFDPVAAGHDVVIGSRFSRHSVLLNYPFAKIVANRGFHALALVLFRRRIRDVTNNLKIMRREVVNDLRLHEPGFAVNAETGLQPLLLGYDVEEVPISWINRTPSMGASSFRLVKVGAGYWRVLGGLWLKHVFNAGPYKDLLRDSHVEKDLPTQAAPETPALR